MLSYHESLTMNRVWLVAATVFLPTNHTTYKMTKAFSLRETHTQFKQKNYDSNHLQSSGRPTEIYLYINNFEKGNNMEFISHVLTEHHQVIRDLFQKALYSLIFPIFLEQDFRVNKYPRPADRIGLVSYCLA